MKSKYLALILIALLLSVIHGLTQRPEVIASGDVVLATGQSTLANSKLSLANSYAFFDMSGNSTTIAQFQGETIEICNTSNKALCVRGVIGTAGSGETYTDIIGGTNPALACGDFSCSTGWTTDTGWVISGGIATATNAASIYRSSSVSSGTLTKKSFTLTGTGGNVRYELGTPYTYYTTYGAIDVYSTITSTAVISVFRGGGPSFTGTLDSITLQSVLTPSTTGFFIRSLPTSADGNAWSIKNASFDPNQASGFTWRIISNNEEGKQTASGTVASTAVKLATVSGGAMLAIDGVDLSPYAGNDAGGTKTIINRRSTTGASITINPYYICLYSSGGSAAFYAGAIGAGEALAAEKSSGTLTIGKLYVITATEANHFGTGFTVGRYFNAAAATTCDANNKVQEVTEVAVTGVHVHSSPNASDRTMARTDAGFNPNAITSVKIYAIAPDGGNLDTKFQGVSWDEISDTYTRTGSLKGTATATSAGNAKLPIQSLMKRCVINDAGVVQYYLCATDSTKKENCSDASDLTGTDGQVMVEIPAFYYRYNYTSPKHTWEISTTPILGFTLHPAFTKDDANVAYRYIGAYEGVLYDTSSAAYTGGNSTQVKDWTATTGDKLSSVSDKFAVTNGTRAQFRTIAANRGTGWRQLDYDLHSAIQLLYLVEYASFYSQSMIGVGISNVSDWITYNNNYPIAKSGNSNAIGNVTGNTAGSTSCATESTKYISYRGIENWYGHLWKFVDGININNSIPYVSNTRANFADDTITNYTALGVTLGNTDGWQNTLLQVSRGFLPASVGASSSTKITDKYYRGSGWRVVIVGGDANDDVLGGGFYFLAYLDASYSHFSVTTRLCF